MTPLWVRERSRVYGEIGDATFHRAEENEVESVVCRVIRCVVVAKVIWAKSDRLGFGVLGGIGRALVATLRAE